MRYRTVPRDAPAEVAARRLGITAAQLQERLHKLVARGFPQPDPDTGLFDMIAIDRWCDARHTHLFPKAEFGAKNAAAVAKDRIDLLKRGSK